MESIQDKLVNKITSQLSKKLDDILIEGLSLKGHKFDNENQLINFIRTRCTCADDGEHRTYFVDEKAFLVHAYKQKYNVDIKNIAESTINAFAGEYFYV